MGFRRGTSAFDRKSSLLNARFRDRSSCALESYRSRTNHCFFGRSFNTRDRTAGPLCGIVSSGSRARFPDSRRATRRRNARRRWLIGTIGGAFRGGYSRPDERSQVSLVRRHAPLFLPPLSTCRLLGLEAHPVEIGSRPTNLHRSLFHFS